MAQRPEVYHSGGTFLLFDASHAVQLRRNRVLSQPVAPLGEVHCLSPQAALVAAINGLATFKRLKAKPNRDLDLQGNKKKYELKMAQLVGRERELFIANRQAELRRHNVTPTAQTMKDFDVTKLRILVESVPLDTELSTHTAEVLSSEEVVCLAQESCVDRRLCHVYQDLFKRGFYLNSGMKFGCDFLAYSDEPVRYHAQYAVRLVPTSCADNAGLVDLGQLDFGEINSIQRMTHTANKIPLFATVTFCPGSLEIVVRYWTLKERIYLTPDSRADLDLVSIEPDLSYPQELARGQVSKLMRTC